MKMCRAKVCQQASKITMKGTCSQSQMKNGVHVAGKQGGLLYEMEGERRHLSPCYEPADEFSRVTATTLKRQGTACIPRLAGPAQAKMHTNRGKCAFSPVSSAVTLENSFPGS